MDKKLKDYLAKLRPASVDQALLDDLRREMSEAVPNIIESIKQRERDAQEARHGHGFYD